MLFTTALSVLLALQAALVFWQGFRIFQLEQAVGIRDKDGKRIGRRSRR